MVGLLRAAGSPTRSRRPNPARRPVGFGAVAGLSPTSSAEREIKMQEPEGRDLGRIYFPSSPSEFITVFAHFHRAEIARMAGWRDRIDRTTNWAITLVAAMLSVSLSTSNAHHTVLMFAMVLA